MGWYLSIRINLKKGCVSDGNIDTVRSANVKGLLLVSFAAASSLTLVWNV